MSSQVGEKQEDAGLGDARLGDAGLGDVCLGGARLEHLDPDAIEVCPED